MSLNEDMDRECENDPELAHLVELETRIVLLEERNIKLKAEVVEWRNMVAVLCRDGGHYLNDHGVKATRKIIENEFYTVLEERERDKE